MKGLNLWTSMPWRNAIGQVIGLMVIEDSVRTEEVMGLEEHPLGAA
jgi:hypothetical protein